VKAIQNGIHREFNKHGVLVTEGKMVDGMREGVWREYYDTGELAIMQHYVKGEPHGKFTSFHLNGAKWSEGTHNNGRCTGMFRVYNENGELVRTMNYKDGTLVEEKEFPEVSGLYVGR
jgi:antitoxin component YwqK of YwqJK toxin-antitoxin module